LVELACAPLAALRFTIQDAGSVDSVLVDQYVYSTVTYVNIIENSSGYRRYVNGYICGVVVPMSS
jgi:hypothetical protein